MTTQSSSNEAVEAAIAYSSINHKVDAMPEDVQRILWANVKPDCTGYSSAYALTAARILTAEVERLRARVAELEELIGLASTSFSMLEAYLGPQWFEAVSNMELVGPDKVHASAALAKKEVER